MVQVRLYECQGCEGRSLTMQACEAVIRSAGEAAIVAEFTGDADSAQLPQGFCGDRHERGLPQQQTQPPEEVTTA